MTAVLSMLSPWVRLYQCFITSNSLNKAHRATPTEGVGQSLVRQHLQERTADMDGLNTPSGGNGPSPKRQRTQVVDGQVCPPHGNESHQDLTDNETERVAAIDAAPEAGTEGGPQLSEGFDNMTETVKAGMFMIQSRTQAADIKVLEISLPRAHTIAHTGMVCLTLLILCSSSTVITMNDAEKACANSLH